MRRFLFTALVVFCTGAAFAQDTTVQTIVRPREARSNDHFLMQLGYTTWTNKPDSINTKGFSRSFNIYLMMDFPFKTNPKWSVAIGPGLGTDHMFFDRTYIGLKDNTPAIRFQDLSDTTHFRKYKLATVYAEAPVELRYRFNPNNDSRSVKMALGIKVGQLLAAHVKGNELEDKNGNTINDYTEKEKSKNFLNKTRLSATARVGVGHFTLFGSYMITPVFREGLGPNVRPLTIGLTLSGL